MRRNRTRIPASPSPEMLLASYLRRLIVTERKCIGGEFLRRIVPRLRWRRIAAARLLARTGHSVDRRVFLNPNARLWSSGERMPNVPPRNSWVGVFTLVPLQEETGEVD